MSQPIIIGYADDLLPFLYVANIFFSEQKEFDLVFTQQVEDKDMVALARNYQLDVLLLGMQEAPQILEEWQFDILDTCRRFQDVPTELILLSEHVFLNKEYVPIIVDLGVRSYLMREEFIFGPLFLDIVRNLCHDKTYTYYSRVIQQILTGH